MFQEYRNRLRVLLDNIAQMVREGEREGGEGLVREGGEGLERGGGGRRIGERGRGGRRIGERGRGEEGLVREGRRIGERGKKDW